MHQRVSPQQEGDGVAFRGERNLLEYTVASETFNIEHGPHVSSATVSVWSFIMWFSVRMRVLYGLWVSVPG